MSDQVEAETPRPPHVGRIFSSWLENARPHPGPLPEERAGVRVDHFSSTTMKRCAQGLTHASPPGAFSRAKLVPGKSRSGTRVQFFAQKRHRTARMVHRMTITVHRMARMVARAARAAKKMGHSHYRMTTIVTVQAVRWSAKVETHTRTPPVSCRDDGRHDALVVNSPHDLLSGSSFACGGACPWFLLGLGDLAPRR